MNNLEGSSDRIISEFAKDAASEGERIKKSVVDKVSGVAEAATNKLNAGIDYVNTGGQAIKKGIEDLTRQGWPGTKEKTLAFTKREPFTALAIALGAGLLLGWLTTRRS
jgi:ElaB/YqjD/DUF883 family membrane-anchored ribosome-binding protein